MDLFQIAGDDISNGNLKTSFTLGEPVADLVKSDNYYINQGFQQSNFSDLFFTPAIDLNGFEVTLYPNPFHTFITIDSERNNINRVEIRNSLGMLIYETQSNKGMDHISNLAFTSGIYSVSIFDSDGHLITTSLTKNYPHHETIKISFFSCAQLTKN